MLNRKQQRRYARNLSMPEIGENGQEKLLRSKVLVAGVGGLGSPAALYLAAAGIGTLALADADRVSLSNLQRQILHTTASVGSAKVTSAAERLQAINPDTRLTLYPFALDRENVRDIVALYDFVIEATDSFHAKLLVARACQESGKPYVHAGVNRFHGQAMTVMPGKTTCFGCLFHHAETQEEENPEGPLGTLPGVLGAIQATEAIKYLLSIGRPLFDTLLTCDLLSMNIRRIAVERDPNCPLCGKF